MEKALLPGRLPTRSWAILDNVFWFVNSKEHVLNPGGRSVSSQWPSADVLLPALLIVALLLCHGILGFAHQLSCHTCEPAGSLGMHHGSAADTEGPASSDAGNDITHELGCLSYAAVLLTTFGAALLGLLLTVRSWREVETRRSMFRWHYSLVVAPRSRGRPTSPSLQVFRL
ncbi:MAG: hypothetical protein QOI57_832 [Rubrobacteraceae bacterium]|nr:hypothetical protein [Rubrobacteraceae bacterium]